MIKAFTLAAQNYHAIQGSPYSGSLGVHNNPASILMSPDKWDITLFGVQAKAATNVVKIFNYSLLSKPGKSEYLFPSGDHKRFGNVAFNLNLLNARFALGRRQAIAFGANIRSYVTLRTSSYNFIDTLGGSGDFFKMNNDGNTYSGKVNSSGWAEIYLAYSRTIIDDFDKRLNAGITLKVNKGLAAGRAELYSGQYDRVGNNEYEVTNARLEYLYSANFDHWNENNSTSENIKDFMKFTDGGLSFDAGIEYLIKPMQVTDIYDGDSYYDYEWKLGFSLLDVGFTQFVHGRESRRASSSNLHLGNIQLDNKFDSTINSVAAFNDSMSTIFTNLSRIPGRFKVINPMRFVFNVDRFLSGNFYLNAELSINVPGSWLKKWYTVKEMNMLTITPRWETRLLGVYLPIQVTNTNRFMIGGAFKAGPLLIGIHNWANIFSKTSMPNGGGYIALVIRSPQRLFSKGGKRLDCPPL